MFCGILFFMPKVSPTYELAESIHTQLFNDAVNQKRGRIFDGEVRADISEPYKTERLTVFGLLDGMRAYQHLSKSRRNGHFYLSTVFTGEGGKVNFTRITDESPEETIGVLEESLFAQAIKSH
jgi:hypothetical protein